ncbi:nitroreductase [Betaproteobacteria bacterium]|nr:nitroreductase [Betaproteobacteria bacterium]GHU01875.1 nitroreductase [Betaproteobacteria bacterium]GHU23978.1 nitroreductase [Betaproteobacteria bacterium]GHU28841.1 nitroreductase [Betaproteobacteria bacterium]
MPDFTPQTCATIAAVLRSRHSIRRFLPTPVSLEVVSELLELAARAPSGGNVQPWRVHALAGDARKALSAAILAEYEQGAREKRDFDFYPTQWSEPWLSRRRKMGFGLYGLLNIAKGDKERMRAQSGRNYLFFDAPVGLILTLDERLGHGMFLDCGVFVGNLLTAARAHGLDTCVQDSFADYPATIRRHLKLGENERIVTGIALGYADPDAPENRLVTEREPVPAFADFQGF